MIKLQHLQSLLEDLEVYKTPNIRLEQYATTPDVAATMLHTIQMRFEDITGKMIADLGCGCGILSIGACLLDAGMCVGVDIDDSALRICQQNLVDTECDSVDLVQADVVNSLDEKWHKSFDVVIMNPPFGTKDNKGIDMEFLKTALSLARTSVYSLHKTTTREHIRKVSKSWKINMESLAELQFALPKTYKKYIHDSLDVKVDLLRFSFPKRNKFR